MIRTLVATLLAALLMPLSGGQAEAGKREAGARNAFFGIHLRDTSGGGYGRIRHTNAGTVRTAFNFSTARPRRDLPYNWRRFDRVVAGTADKGLRLLPVLYGVPSWIRDGRNHLLGKRVRAAWKEYLQALVLRYGRGGDFWAEHDEVPYRPVRHWQIWNEPNSFVNWPDPDPHEYGRFLIRSSEAIHAVDPRAKVVSAGVVADPINGDAERGAHYLERMFGSKRAARAADLVAVHPYAKNVAKEKDLIGATRRVMNRAGLRRTPIWVTEVGWGNRAKQRRYLRRSLEMTYRQRRRFRLRGVVWYQWQDGHDPACGWCVTSGLIRDDGAAKPLLRVFRSASRRAPR